MNEIRSLTEFRNPKCNKCGLCKDAEYICLTGYGSIKTSILIIGEAPGHREDESGRPFVGKAGKVLDVVLQQLGLSREQVYITNAVHCRPPENHKISLDEIRACRSYLEAEIKKINPKIIITLGDTAVKAIYNSNLTSISKERGRLTYNEEFKAHIISTYHPAYALRKPEAAKWIFADIKSGLELNKIKDKTLDLDYQEIKGNAQTALKEITKYGVVSIDLETSSLDMYDPKGEIKCIGFCNTKGKAWIYFNDRPGMVEFTQKVLDATDILIGHNIKFDLKWMYTRGLTYKKQIWDTMVAIHLLDENYPEKALKHLARTELGVFGQKLAEYSQTVQDHWENKTEPTNEEWLIYNGGDVDATWRLYKKFGDALVNQNLIRLMTQEMHILKALIYMEMNGFHIDKKKFSQIEKDYSAQIADSQHKLKAILGDINLASTLQLRECLYVKRNLPILLYTPTKEPSCSEQAITELLRTRIKKEDKEALELLLKFRNASKLFNTYIKGIREGGLIKNDSKMHCNYKITGTVTGRLSCSEPNLQNIPREGSIKLMFTSRFNGGQIIQGDYSQAELRLLAHHANSESLINAFLSGRDIHREVASKVFKKPYDTITEQERKFTKQVNFGIVYLISPQGLAEKLNVSDKEAGRLIDEWFEEFPEVQVWIKKMKLKVITEGYTSNIFGRRRRFFGVNENTGEGREAQRQGVNSPIQGGAGDLTKYAMAKTLFTLRKEGFKSLVIGNVHDAIMIDSPREEVEEVVEILHDIATHPIIDLKVPMDMDIKVGPSWGELKEYKLKKGK